MRFNFFVISLFKSSILFAYPVFDEENQCINNSIPTWAGTEINKKIFYYVEIDAGSQMKECLLNGNGLSSFFINHPNSTINENFTKIVISAAETWNLESNGITLNYAGTLDIDDINISTCNSIPSNKRPAVFVQFHAGCISANGFMCNSATANWKNASNCYLTSQITVAGDRNTLNSCSGSAIIDWNYFEDEALDLKSTLIHEFGHALGLGHPFEYENDNDPNTTNPVEDIFGNDHSVMSYWGEGLTGQRHLYLYDQDCVDDNQEWPNLMDNRKLNPYRVGINSSGSFSSVIKNNIAIEKISTSGGVLNKVVNGSYQHSYPYFTFGSSFIYFSPINSDGNLILASNVFDLNYSEILELSHISNHFYSNYANPQSYMIYPRVYDSPVDPWFFDLIEPPIMEIVSSNNFSQNLTKYNLFKECIGSSCSSTSTIQSNIPIDTYYNPLSLNQIYAVTETREFYQCRIGIHAGNFSVDTLKTKQLPPSGTYPNDGYSSFNFTGKTDIKPAIACSDNSSVNFNCILMWVDRGIPEFRILYCYFNHNASSGSIVFSNNIYSFQFNNNVSSVGGIDLDYFGGKFYAAWKTIDNNIGYSHGYPSNNAITWSNPIYLNRDNVVDPPSWSSHDINGYESSLVWSENKY